MGFTPFRSLFRVPYSAPIPPVPYSPLPYSPLRHTNLRKIIEAKGIHVAMKQSGHRSDKYIWRYTQPSDTELKALTMNWTSTSQ